MCRPKPIKSSFINLSLINSSLLTTPSLYIYTLFYVSSKTAGLLNSFIPFNQILKPHGMNCLSSASVFLMHKVEVPYVWWGLLMMGGHGWVGEWEVTVDSLRTKPSSTFSDSHKCLLLSLFLGCHLTYTRLLKCGESSHFKVWDLGLFVPVEGSGGIISPQREAINRKWETWGIQGGRFLLVSLPQDKIPPCNTLRISEWWTNIAVICCVIPCIPAKQ